MKGELLEPRPNCPLTDGRSNLSKCFLTLGRRIKQLQEQSGADRSQPGRLDPEEDVPAPETSTTTVGVQTEKILVAIHKWSNLMAATTQTDTSAEYLDCAAQTSEEYTASEDAWDEAWTAASAAVKCGGATWWCKQAAAGAMVHGLLPGVFWRWIARTGSATMLLQNLGRSWVFQSRYTRLAARYLYGPDAARLRHHNLVLQHLVCSERAYVSLLKHLMSALGEPTTESQAVFPGLSEMVQAHEKVLQFLDHSHQQWPRCPSVLQMDQILSHVSPLLSVYETFVPNAPAALELCNHLFTSQNLQFVRAAQRLLEMLAPRASPNQLAEAGHVSGSALMALVLLPLQRIATYGDWVQLGLSAGDGTAGAAEALGALRDKLSPTVAHVSDMAAAHLFAFHRQFNTAAEVLLALPTASPVRAALRAQFTSPISGATVNGFPSTAYIFSDVLVWGAYNPALGPGEAVLGVYPLGRRYEHRSDGALILYGSDSHDALVVKGQQPVISAMTIAAAVAMALQPVVSVVLPQHQPAVLPVPPRLLQRVARLRGAAAKSVMVVHYQLKGHLRGFSHSDFSAAYAKEVGVPLVNVSVVAVKPEDGNVTLEVELPQPNHDAVVGLASALRTQPIAGWSVLAEPTIELPGAPRELEWALQLLGLPHNKIKHQELSTICTHAQLPIPNCSNDGNLVGLEQLRSWLACEHFTSKSDQELDAALSPVAAAIREQLVRKWSTAVLTAFGPEAKAINASEFGAMLQAYDPGLSNLQVEASVAGVASAAGHIGHGELCAWLRDTFGHLHNKEFEMGMRQVVQHAQLKATVLIISDSEEEVLRYHALEARAQYQNAIRRTSQIQEQIDTSDRSEAIKAEQEAFNNWMAAEQDWEQHQAAGAGVVTLWLLLRGCGAVVNATALAREQWQADLRSEIAGALEMNAQQVQVLALRESNADAVLQLQLTKESELHEMVSALRKQINHSASALRSMPIMQSVASDIPIEPRFGSCCTAPSLGMSPRSREEHSSTLGLRVVLHQPEALKHLLSFLAGNGKAGPLLLFQAIDKYRETESWEARAALLDIMRSLHWSSYASAGLRVHLPLETESQIEGSIAAHQFSVQLLDNTQVSIKRLIEVKFLPEFAESQQYKSWKSETD